MTISVPDLTDPNAVLNYGADAQAKIADFSEMVLQNLEREQTEEVNDKITSLVNRLKDSAEEKNGKFFFFRKGTAAAKIRYRKTCETVDRIARALQNQKDRLMRDIEMLELLQTMNREQYQALTEYVDRGKEALEQFRENQRNFPYDKETLADREERFEKKLHDLDLTRAISLQMAPQIRLLQNNNVLLAEKIQATLTNVIPLWKSQIVFALTLNNTKQTLKTQEKVSDVTNALLQQNAKNLQETTIAATRYAQQGHTTVKTLTETNGILLETLEKMLELRKEGQRVRREAEGELRRLEQSVRLRLLPEQNTV